MIKMDCADTCFKKEDWIFYKYDFYDWLITISSEYSSLESTFLTLGIVDYVASKSKNNKDFINSLVEIFGNPKITEKNIRDFLEKV